MLPRLQSVVSFCAQHFRVWRLAAEVHVSLVHVDGLAPPVLGGLVYQPRTGKRRAVCRERLPLICTESFGPFVPLSDG